MLVTFVVFLLFDSTKTQDAPSCSRLEGALDPCRPQILAKCPSFGQRYNCPGGGQSFSQSGSSFDSPLPAQSFSSGVNAAPEIVQTIQAQPERVEPAYRTYVYNEYERKHIGDGRPLPSETIGDDAQYATPLQLMQQCCEENQVDPGCMDLCSYRMDLSEADMFCRTNCVNDLKKIAYCAANEKDNTECCQLDKDFQRAKAKHCLPFCNGHEDKFPTVDEMLEKTASAKKYARCFDYSVGVMRCHETKNSRRRDYHVQDWGPPETFPNKAVRRYERECKSSRGK